MTALARESHCRAAALFALLFDTLHYIFMFHILLYIFHPPRMLLFLFLLLFHLYSPLFACCCCCFLLFHLNAPSHQQPMYYKYIHFCCCCCSYYISQIICVILFFASFSVSTHIYVVIVRYIFFIYLHCIALHRSSFVCFFFLFSSFISQYIFFSFQRRANYNNKC